MTIKQSDIEGIKELMKAINKTPINEIFIESQDGAIKSFAELFPSYSEFTGLTHWYVLME